MILIIGTPDSGKSALAENIAVKLSNGQKMAYVATMIPFGEEGEKRIEKHRKLRATKNFDTFEEAYTVSKLCKEIKTNGYKTALLECVSNLVGNVIHKEENLEKKKDDLVCEIISDICEFSNAIDNSVVVANYFDIDPQYDNDTIKYIDINNLVNEKLKLKADKYIVKEGEEWITYENN